MEWYKNIGGTQNDSVTNVIETTDGGVIVIGTFSSAEIVLEEGLVLKNGNKFIIKYSDKGEIIWAKQIEGVNINSGIPTIDGGLLIGGSFIGNIELENGTNFNARDKDGIIIKYEKSGKMEWAPSCRGW